MSVFKYELKHSYFVGPLSSTHNRLPPLRPYISIFIRQHTGRTRIYKNICKLKNKHRVKNLQ